MPGLKGRLSGPDGILTLAGYRDAGVWRQGVRWHEMQSEILGM